MIIINTGIPKSATTLLFDYQRKIIKSISALNGIEGLEKFRKSAFYIPLFNDDIYLNILNLHKMYGDIIIKKRIYHLTI